MGEVIGKVAGQTQIEDEDTQQEVKIQRDWLTFKETMSWLNTSKSALVRPMAEGMHFIKLGNQLRFSPDKLKPWLEANAS